MSRRASYALGASLLLAVVFTLYAGVGRNAFVNYDDDHYVTANPMVSRGLTSDGLRWALTAREAANWHPLTWLSHMLDVELYGLDPAGHHRTSVALHAANAALLFWALARLTGRLAPSLAVAALFAVHPLRVESVAWVAERKDVLSGLCFVLALHAYASWVRDRKAGSYAALVAATAAGLAAKPMLVTLPFLLLLLDSWPLGRRRALLEKLPLVLLALASSAVTLVAQTAGGSLRAWDTWPLGPRVANAALSYLTYLAKTVWPVDLACFYPHPAITGPGGLAGRAVLAAVVLGAATAGALLSARRFPWITCGWLWYLGMLVPVIGVVQVGSQALADRYTYLPQIGLLIVLAFSLDAWTAGRPRLRRSLLGAGLVVLTTLSVVTRAQLHHWRDSRSLFEHALAVTKNNYVAHNNLGSALEEAGDLAGAAGEFERALAIRPDFAPARNNLGLCLVAQGRATEAVEQFELALAVDPRWAEPRNNLGAAFDRLGQPARAAAELRLALAAAPDHVEAHNNLGVALERLGDRAGAAAESEAAQRLDPRSAEALSNLGNLRLAEGDREGARARYEAALEARPDFAEAHNNLAFVLERSGDARGAVTHYTRALEIAPGLRPAVAGLAWILATSADAEVRDGARARALAEICAEKDPACLEALAAAHAELGDFESAVRFQERAVALGAPAERLRLYRSGVPFRE